MNPDEERDELWDLLGKAKQPPVSPFFARDVLREIRVQQPEKQTPWRWFVARWRVVTLGTAAIAVAATLGVQTLRNSQPASPRMEIAQQPVESTDYEVIARLDELLASESNSIWLDNSSE